MTMRKPGMFRPKLRRRGKSDEAAAGGNWWGAYYRRDLGADFVVANTGFDNRTSVAYTPIYPWGMMRQDGGGDNSVWGATDLTTGMMGGGLANALYAIPNSLPAGTIRRLVWGQPGAGGTGGYIRLGIYTASVDDLYPAALLYDSGAVIFPGSGVKNTAAISVPVTPGLYYAVITCDTAAAVGTNGITILARLLYPVLGATLRWGNGEPRYNDSLAVGWRHTQTFGPLPAVFPSSSPYRLVITPGGDRVPCMFYGFSPT